VLFDVFGGIFIPLGKLPIHSFLVGLDITVPPIVILCFLNNLNIFSSNHDLFLNSITIVVFFVGRYEMNVFNLTKVSGVNLKDGGSCIKMAFSFSLSGLTLSQNICHSFLQFFNRLK